MALVFKVKFQDTLRRWVATESLNADSFSITFGQLEAKIKELFNLAPSASLVITYVDNDNDVVTLADDQDLIDACVVQRLNPLRLNVDGSSNSSEGVPLLPRTLDTPMLAENVNIEAFLNALFPQATADAVKGFLRTYAPFIDPDLPAAACLAKAENAFKEFLNGLAHAHPKFTEKFAPHHLNEHPYPAMSSPLHRDRCFHWKIECDGCGMPPIEGPRYKSTKKLDYDLCGSCFKTMGNENDYEKINYSLHPPPHGHYRPRCFKRGPRPFPAPPGCKALFARGQYGWKPNNSFSGHQASGSLASDEHKKLDARFVKDVTIFDGTELSPGTKFTKIWRMANIGMLPWPQSTQLVHIGGDVLCAAETVFLELPEGGLPCGEEVEVSVDLTAPQKPGRYVSHWRLTSPFGQKFGHRVWVVIHVVPKGQHSPQYQISLQNGKSSVEVNKEMMDVDSDGRNTVTVDMDLNGANKVFLDVLVDGETAVIEQLSVEKPHHNDHEIAHALLVYPDPSSPGLEDVPKGEHAPGYQVSLQNEKSSVVVNKEITDVDIDGRNTVTLDVDLNGASKVILDVIVDGETAITEKFSVEKLRHNDHENAHTLLVYPDPSSPGLKDVTSSEKPMELGENTLAVYRDPTSLDLQGGSNMVKYPDPSLNGLKDGMSVEKSVEIDLNLSDVYPDPTSHDSQDVDMSTEKALEGDVDRKYEVDGFSLVEKPTESTDWFEIDEHESFYSPDGPKEGENVGLASMLQVLESMGFADRNVNFAILQSRNFVLQDAVNDLLFVAGWGVALKDLEEMGFNDKASNVCLLVKNKGSLKQTVRDLVKLEKAVVDG